jgi:hypothetical protein
MVWKEPDVAENHIAAVFTVEEQTIKNMRKVELILLPASACFLHGLLLDLKMEVI